MYWGKKNSKCNLVKINLWKTKVKVRLILGNVAVKQIFEGCPVPEWWENSHNAVVRNQSEETAQIWINNQEVQMTKRTWKCQYSYSLEKCKGGATSHPREWLNFKRLQMLARYGPKELQCIAARVQDNVCRHSESSLVILFKVKYALITWPLIHLFKTKKIYGPIKTCTYMFTDTIHVSQISVDLWAGKLLYTHKMEYYSTIKRSTVRHVAQINLKSVLLNKQQTKMD